MRAVFFRLIGVVTLMLAAAGLVGWLAGPLPGVLAASVVALSVIGQDTAAQLRLLAWLKWPQLDNLPVMRGVWAEVFYRTARQFRLWETRLAREEDKLRRFIEALQASPNGVILMDASDQIDWCNDTAAAHFGLDPQRDLRQHAVHLIRNPEFFGYMGAKRFDEPLLMRRNGARGSLLLSVQVISYG
ncbi:MAG: PAS domain-containing sensor histidine kinase, partial [Thiomonas sp. 14-66-4]